MKSFRNRRRVAFRADDMFALVRDVESYPKFVPLCEALRVRRRTTTEEGKEIIVAEMEVGFKAVCERFTSRVTCDAAKREILVEYIDGPFKKLENRWTFVDEPDGADGGARSVVEFYINYEFRSRALGLVMGAMFDQAFHKYADAFVKRAGEVYGRR
ncbi:MULTISPECIES: type II toxin-antitoxin system RatA family toxin [Methylosinus]|uniref:Ubiquinone-binding protein n=1 Tax=Methylosinus trichosporium (strain ATCC 35070 / NCIMB 11131 / UNIQEM 75 / OB3b) TaxID=595536 RepID=A0A2D2CVT0_METT3|nr:MULTISPECIES: SRPBCC family protein [Methylosinus]ATQ66749.1 ubiquinone-binding protein [Methylosinus trichosporium OB3b]OBS51410.1 ubiquinone-binding protein [Methylosinus sp. 3S-1]